MLLSLLDEYDWNLVYSLRRVLKRFDDATKVLSERKYPTLSLSYGIILSLSNYLKSHSDDAIDNRIKEPLINSFNKYMIRG